jgi:hypothetical protein
MRIWLNCEAGHESKNSSLKRGAKGASVFRLRAGRGIAGSVVQYGEEGVWFQDVGRLRSGEMVLVKWAFIEAIVCDVRISEPEARRDIGFRAMVRESQ